MPVYLQLAGPNNVGRSPKSPTHTGWNEPAYRGVQSEDVAADAWLGLRLDDYVVVDCDCRCVKVGNRKPDVCKTQAVADAARMAWCTYIQQPVHHTWTRKTPHGYHLIYAAPPISEPTVQSRKLNGIFPSLELKAGIGHQIAYSAPGYFDIPGATVIAKRFDTSWLPPVEAVRPADEWSELPDGSGDDFMISIAGKLREWGAEAGTIADCLAGINAATMTRSPMPQRSINRIARSAARYAPGDALDRSSFECPTCSTTWEGS